MSLVPLTVGDVLEEIDDRLGRRPERVVMTLTEGRGFVDQAVRFSKRLATADTSNYKVVARGEVAFNPYLLWAGAIAQNSLWDYGVVSPAYPTFRVRAGFDARYVGHVLRCAPMLKRYDAISYGSVPRRRRASVEDFLRVPLPGVPPLADQHRSANALDRADSLREKRSEALLRVGELAQALFLQQFGGNEPTTDTIESLLADQPNAIRTGPFGSQLLVEEFTESGVPVLGIDNFVTGTFNLDSRRFISREKYERLKRFQVRPNDVGVTIMGTVGRVALVPDCVGDAISTKHLCMLTVDTRRCLPSYLRAYLLWHPAAAHHFGKNAKGAIMDGLNMSIIRALPVAVPPMGRQLAFERALDAIADIQRASERAAADLNALASSLQQRVFRGDLFASPLPAELSDVAG